MSRDELPTVVGIGISGLNPLMSSWELVLPVFFLSGGVSK